MPRRIDNGFPVDQGFYCTPIDSDGFRIEKVERKPVSNDFLLNSNNLAVGIDLTRYKTLPVDLFDLLGKPKNGFYIKRCLFDENTFYATDFGDFRYTCVKKVAFFDVMDDNLIFSHVQNFHYINPRSMRAIFLDKNTSYGFTYNNISVIRWKDGEMQDGHFTFEIDGFCSTLVSKTLIYFQRGMLKFAKMDNEAIDRGRLRILEVNFTLSDDINAVRPSMHFNVCYASDQMPVTTLCILFTDTLEAWHCIDFFEFFPSICDLNINSLDDFQLWYLSLERRQAMCTFKSGRFSHLCVFDANEVLRFDFELPRTMVAPLPRFTPEFDHRMYLSRMFGTFNNHLSLYSKYFSIDDIVVECRHLSESQTGMFAKHTFFKTRNCEIIFSLAENVVYYHKLKPSFEQFHFNNTVIKLHGHLCKIKRGVEMDCTEVQLFDVQSLKDGVFPLYRVLFRSNESILLLTDEHMYWCCSEWNAEEQMKVIQIFETCLETNVTKEITELRRHTPVIYHYDKKKILLKCGGTTQCYELNNNVWELTREITDNVKAHINPYSTELSISPTKKKHFFVCDSEQNLKIQFNIGYFIRFLAPRIVLLNVGIFRITKKCRLTKIVDFDEDNFDVSECDCFQAQNSLTIFTVVDRMIIHRRYEFNDTHILNIEIHDIPLDTWLTRAEYVEMNMFRESTDTGAFVINIEHC
ncbi:hypothetical protein PCE1_002573 [Barthelona sp. PCE]